MLLSAKGTTHSSYQLVTVGPAFTLKTIDCMHKTGPRKGAQHATVCY